MLGGGGGGGVRDVLITPRCLYCCLCKALTGLLNWDIEEVYLDNRQAPNKKLFRSSIEHFMKSCPIFCRPLEWVAGRC